MQGILQGRPMRSKCFARRQGGKRYATGQVSQKGVGAGGGEAEALSQKAMSNSSGSVGNLGTALQAPHGVRVSVIRSHEHAIY